MDHDKGQDSLSKAKGARSDISQSAGFWAGSLTFEVPADCPDKTIFESVVREELKEHFGKDTNRAAFCKGEYDGCQQVPAPFQQNRKAEGHYQEAQMALSPGAQQWDRFDSAVFARFLDTADDGDAQSQPIPGWYMSGSMKVTVR